MRASTAFFAGIGTVGVAIAGGLGGGLWIAGAMNPHASKYALEAATLDPYALPASAPLPYVGATLAFMAPDVDGRAPARDQRADRGNAAPLALRPVEAKASTDQPAESTDAAAVKQPSQDARATAAAKPPEDAFAKARNSDLKHQADRRRAERAQRWASRHRHDQPNQQSQQDQANSDQQANNDANNNSRNDSSGKSSDGKSSDRRYPDRRYHGYHDGRPRYRDAERWYPDDREQRYYREDPPSFDLPQVRLFGPDD